MFFVCTAYYVTMLQYYAALLTFDSRLLTYFYGWLAYGYKMRREIQRFHNRYGILPRQLLGTLWEWSPIVSTRA